MRKLYVLDVQTWDMDRYIRSRDYNESISGNFDYYLFPTEEQAKEYAKKLKGNESTYYEVCLIAAEISEEDILEVTGFDTIEEFDEALNTPYSSNSRTTNYGEIEKKDVCMEIVQNCSYDEEWLDIQNYDIDKSIEGSIVVVWSWQTHVGYARKCAEVRYVTSGETEANCVQEDKVFRNMMSVVLNPEQIAGLSQSDLRQQLYQELLDGSRDWKWQNPKYVQSRIDELTD